MEREQYLVNSYIEKKEYLREVARQDFKESVRKILEFEDAGIITTSEVIDMIARYGKNFEEINRDYIDTLNNLSRLRKNFLK